MADAYCEWPDCEQVATTDVSYSKQGGGYAYAPLCAEHLDVLKGEEYAGIPLGQIVTKVYDQPQADTSMWGGPSRSEG
jgi:hypothetical protein